jgi:uncharacterized protein YhfF
MTIPTHLAEFWADFCFASGGTADQRFCAAFCFGDSEKMANELGELVLSGQKRATAGSLWGYDGAALPQPGELNIVTNWSDQPLCIIETRSVEIVPFSAVTAEFAAAEGEGDGSLTYWRQVHQEFFVRDCLRIGRQFSESMPVVCERFAVVHPIPSIV